MPKRIYVGNLPINCSDDEIRELFGTFGTVESVSLPTDRLSRPESGGPAYVEMKNTEDADRAIRELNGKSVGGNALEVRVA